MTKTAEIKKEQEVSKRKVKVKELHLNEKQLEDLKRPIFNEFIGRVSSPIIGMLDKLSTEVEKEV